MNILLLTKTKSHLSLDYDAIEESVLRADNFFGGYYRAFIKMGHQVSVSCVESTVISSKFKIKKPFISKIIRGCLKVTGLYLFDKLLTSIFISFLVKRKKIDFIFTELNSTFYPNIIRRLFPNIVIAQWFGVFPDSNKALMKSIRHYDINFTPCIFADEVRSTFFYGTDVYIGCAAEILPTNPNLNLRPKSNRLLFYGGITKRHTARNDLLKKLGDSVDIFGYVESDVEQYFHEKCRGFIPASNLYNLISEYKYALNIGLDGFQKIKVGHNNRLFEIAASGSTLQFVERSDFVRDFFEDDEVIQFDDVEELSKLIASFEKNEALRLQVCNRALSRSRRYTYDARAQKIIDCVTALSARRGVPAC